MKQTSLLAPIPSHSSAASPARLLPLIQNLCGAGFEEKRVASQSRALIPKRHFPLHGTKLSIIGQNGQPIHVKICVRENARRLILRVDRRSGEPRLTMPPRVAKRRAEAFLVEHTGWLETRISALPQAKRFIAGAEIPIRGVMHRIRHMLPFRGETRIALIEGTPCLLVHGDAAHISARVIRFLKAEALRDIEAAVSRHAARLGVEIGTLSIKDTRSRWGSCAAKGNLAFSWRLILAPPFVLDYLAAHEVAHRREMNHSPRYWQHVEMLIPDYRKAERWLHLHGLGLHLYEPC